MENRKSEIGAGVEGVNPRTEQIIAGLGGTTGSTVRRQFDGRYIVVNQIGMKVAGPFDGAPDNGLTLATDAASNLDSVTLRNALIDAIPTVAYSSYTGPHG